MTYLCTAEQGGTSTAFEEGVEGIERATIIRESDKVLFRPRKVRISGTCYFNKWG